MISFLYIITYQILYARHYNPRFVYFFPIFEGQKSLLRSFFRKFLTLCTVIAFKSGLKSRAGYSGARTVILLINFNSFHRQSYIMSSPFGAIPSIFFRGPWISSEQQAFFPDFTHVSDIKWAFSYILIHFQIQNIELKSKSWTEAQFHKIDYLLSNIVKSRKKSAIPNLF